MSRDGSATLVEFLDLMVEQVEVGSGGRFVGQQVRDAVLQQVVNWHLVRSDTPP